MESRKKAKNSTLVRIPKVTHKKLTAADFCNAKHESNTRNIQCAERNALISRQLRNERRQAIDDFDLRNETDYSRISNLTAVSASRSASDNRRKNKSASLHSSIKKYPSTSKAYTKQKRVTRPDSDSSDSSFPSRDAPSPSKNNKHFANLGKERLIDLNLRILNTVEKIDVTTDKIAALRNIVYKKGTSSPLKFVDLQRSLSEIERENGIISELEKNFSALMHERQGLHSVFSPARQIDSLAARFAHL